ncbi:hypothetical protein [Streptomyces sp. SID3212]|uniref:hypothetical protein n=1 Tax=unclassified Streptomyces TaxID=2593676 RepID=UPI0013713393|nr:hypothetical protein [Streptomyces sp. SID3212]MYV52280.1 hypothetical protein [Streptomyces sp. SID3212]
MTAASAVPQAEREIVTRIGRYYEKDGMAADRGEVIGYLLISDPARQRASEISARLGISRDAVDKMSDQLVPAGFFIREDTEDGDYYLTLQDATWPRVIQHTFLSWPNFHRTMADGLEALEAEGVGPARLARLRNMEKLFRYLAAEMPALWHRYEKASADLS